MDWKQYGLNWWEKEEVINYREPTLHPHYAGSSATADVDIQWFEVKQTQEWMKCSVEYFPIGKLFFGYKNKEDGSFHLSVGAQGMDKNGLTNIEDENPDHRCSIWVADLEEKENNAAAPLASLRFCTFERFHLDLSLKVLPPKAYIGLYAIDWYW